MVACVVPAPGGSEPFLVYLRLLPCKVGGEFSLPCVTEILHSKSIAPSGEISQSGLRGSDIIITDDDTWYNCQHYLRKVLGADPVGALLPTPGLLSDRRRLLFPARFNPHEVEFQIAFYSAGSAVLAPCSGLYFYICDLLIFNNFL